jgi:hypothetical protein
LRKQILSAIIYLYLFSQSAQIFGSEGGAGIPPPTLPSRAARTAGDFAKRRERLAQKSWFALNSEYATNLSLTDFSYAHLTGAGA